MTEDPFDGWIPRDYRRLWPHLFEPAVLDPAVDFVIGLAGGGRVLELGVGTGRLAWALAARGVRVHGIERSRAMVEVLRAESGSGAVEVTIGDMATTRVVGTYAVVVLVRNTIMNLTSQQQQVDCFHNAAAHLAPGGCFIVEVVVPPWQRLGPGGSKVVFDASAAHIGIDEIDVATQQSWSHHVFFADGGTRHFRAPFRYVWPAELDLMARLAGMRRRERWADWSRAPFGAESTGHVSVWTNDGGGG